jgi:deoxyribodipyrimidine photo-lyase
MERVLDLHELSRRCHTLARPGRPGRGACMLYWMHREHRMDANWALLLAARLAREENIPLAVVCCLPWPLVGINPAQAGFLVQGLAELETGLAGHGIPLALLQGDPGREIPALARHLGALTLVTDFDPLRHKRAWTAEAAQAGLRVLEVDSRNIVPCRQASDKREYMARTIRPRIHRKLPDFLVEPPAFAYRGPPWSMDRPCNDWDLARARGRTPPAWITPGEAAAKRALDDFLAAGLPDYAARQNDPVRRAVSRLSPYLHAGQISSLRCVWEVMHSGAGADNIQEFLEQIVVRRELADNFCFHAPDYDTVNAFPDWARRTLWEHAGDPRPHLYSRDRLAGAETHDELWNAAQLDLAAHGWMHGYLRMYWAKKILEWSPDVEEALAVCVDLNDSLQLDGHDANGYTGMAWSLGGVHDRPWKRRPVFGSVRYMSAAGMRRKFDVDAYVRAAPAGGASDGGA